jgi:hypothetical protein
VSTRRRILTGRLATDKKSSSAPSFREVHRAVGSSSLEKETR